MKKAKITLNTLLAGETKALEFISIGQAEEKGENLKISYEESEVTGLTNTKTIIELFKDSKKDCVSITREGEFKSHLVFSLDKSHSTFYETPYGTFDIVIETKKLDVVREEKCSDIKISYITKIQGEVQGTTNIDLTVEILN